MEKNTLSQPQERRQSMLLTGSGGMLGSYIREVMRGWNITGLSRRASDSDIACDLTRTVPALPASGFDLVVHAAGTRDAARAVELNLEGTRRLLSALETAPPRAFVFISDAAVYGRTDGEDIDEESAIFAADKVGQSKILAEREVTAWCAARGVTLTILRPVAMFGDGVGGEMAELFREVTSGRYVHLRGNEARLSVVTALEVALAVKAVWSAGGIYNVADGRNPRLIELAEAMSANAGARRRMWHLPPRWAAVLRHIPGAGTMLDADRMERRSRTLTFSAGKLMSTGWTPRDTLAVIAREDTTYPYRE